MSVASEISKREIKLRELELKIRMRRFLKLKSELLKVKDYLLNDIEQIEQLGNSLPKDLVEIKDELIRYNEVLVAHNLFQ
ncbi:hypothetical protein KKA14_21985 [bacterium]|nr:hypothetical protein [bacterium]